MLVAIYGFNELQQWVILDLVTVDEYLELPRSTVTEFVQASKIQGVMMKTFIFNTGVKNPKVLMKGHKLAPNGVMVIPFDCDNVPDNATFKFAADYPELAKNGIICREIQNSALISKYAFFQI